MAHLSGLFRDFNDGAARAVGLKDGGFTVGGAQFKRLEGGVLLALDVGRDLRLVIDFSTAVAAGDHAARSQIGDGLVDRIALRIKAQRGFASVVVVCNRERRFCRVVHDGVVDHAAADHGGAVAFYACLKLHGIGVGIGIRAEAPRGRIDFHAFCRKRRFLYRHARCAAFLNLGSQNADVYRGGVALIGLGEKLRPIVGFNHEGLARDARTAHRDLSAARILDRAARSLAVDGAPHARAGMHGALDAAQSFDGRVAGKRCVIDVDTKACRIAQVGNRAASAHDRDIKPKRKGLDLRVVARGNRKRLARGLACKRAVGNAHRRAARRLHIRVGGHAAGKRDGRLIGLYRGLARNPRADPSSFARDNLALGNVESDIAVLPQRRHRSGKNRAACFARAHGHVDPGAVGCVFTRFDGDRAGFNCRAGHRHVRCARRGVGRRALGGGLHHRLFLVIGENAVRLSERRSKDSRIARAARARIG